VTNREQAEQGYAALARDDLDGFLAMIHPEVEFTSLIAEAEGKTYSGHDGVREWWATVKPILGGLEWELEEIREVGADHVLVHMQVVGTLEGAPIAQTMFQAVENREGLVGWWGVFRTEAEALKALAERA
jgi:ketosteroid isomerase-like protein